VAYLTRGEAVARRPDSLPGHIYQGDLFESLTLMVPLEDGTWADKLWDVLVVSHDCEYTKIAEKPSKPLLVAPVRKMVDYSQRDAIVAGEAYGLWALPQEAPVDDEYVADFRLIQPIAVRQLQEAKHWACLDDELRIELAVRIEQFLFRGRLA